MRRMLYLAILTESLVELIFKAAPLQGARRSIIAATPFLRSEEQGHLLECKFCTSTWIGAGVILISSMFSNKTLRLAGDAFVITRLSNLFHTVVALARDIQINKRLERK